MKAMNPTPAVIMLLIPFLILSCGRDPRESGVDKPRDVVSITKVTAHATKADGAPMRALVGTVKMSHRVHEEHGIGCETCHHKKGNDDRIKTCAAPGCHTGVKGFRVMHGLCEDCHNARQPVREKCMRCH